MTGKTRIVFWGSPGIAASFLRDLVHNHSDRFVITACVTQTEKTIQRQGKTAARSKVHDTALELGLPVLTPKSVKKEAREILSTLSTFGYDLFVVVAYGKILPQSIIDAPPLKSVNFHGSLLPLLRGASPIEHSLLYGFRETGWTLQRIVEKLDAGDIIAQSQVVIDENETTGTLYEKLSADLIQNGAQMLADYADGKVTPRPQDESAATHCGKISAEDGRLNFERPAHEIFNRCRAFTPRPGVFAMFRGKKVKLALSPPPVPLPTRGEGVPEAGVGTLTKHGKTDLSVVCGDGNVLNIVSVTPEGKKPMAVADFMNGYRLQDGDRFE
ncbi:methionyl-tRNA formyltransferase [Turneriella parva]|uniref:Methionyl-tRNA formyltransferase n=1 Tax=Turneriella parva (strain ATCC BAA-1111 / DSM 21527 / NCTC 11395 / H) TaxID=869212 RepID=I4B602_TURPD|nr:methionyl-tRNA formyltransferase [Turneriella parva]AFM12709.1 Methionyl-tRNA formyltransferase [Turneriella parva DSM 21527]